ncbi:hypothetical protein Pst134EB_023439 [Puccinia striiformis f. sp. tritici]|nr:hypothetical protein Pst134EB_023439 [Puccinia striiformis f. sp. tritici]
MHSIGLALRTGSVGNIGGNYEQAALYVEPSTAILGGESVLETLIETHIAMSTEKPS